MTNSTMKHRRLRVNSAPVLIPLSDGAEICSVTTKTIRRWIAEGRLTGYRLGPRVLRVDQDEVLAFARPLATA